MNRMKFYFAKKINLHLLCIFFYKKNKQLHHIDNFINSFMINFQKLIGVLKLYIVAQRFDAFLAHIGPKENYLSCLFGHNIISNGHIRSLEIILLPKRELR